MCVCVCVALFGFVFCCDLFVLFFVFSFFSVAAVPHLPVLDVTYQINAITLRFVVGKAIGLWSKR